MSELEKHKLRCPSCNETLSDEHHKAIKNAILVMMSPAGKYLEFDGNFMCEKCADKPTPENEEK